MMDKIRRMMIIKLFKKYLTIIFREVLEVMASDQHLEKRKSNCLSKIIKLHSMKIISKDNEEMIILIKMISFLKRILMHKNKVLRMQKK